MTLLHVKSHYIVAFGGFFGVYVYDDSVVCCDVWLFGVFKICFGVLK